MLINNKVLIKNGICPEVNNVCNWTLSFNMATNIVLVSTEGEMFETTYDDSLMCLIQCAKQMNITADTLRFHFDFLTKDIEEFLVNHMVVYSCAKRIFDASQNIDINEDIRRVFTDEVNIAMFHMMFMNVSNYMQMDVDSNTHIDDTCMEVDLDLDFLDCMLS